MADFMTPGGEVRFVDFVTEAHMLQVTRAIKAAGIDLGIFRDAERSKFLDVRAMTKIEAGLRGLLPAVMGEEQWQSPVKELCAQVVETGEAIKSRTPYGFCAFGLAIHNQYYESPRRVAPGTWTYPTPSQSKLLFVDEKALLKGTYPVGIHPLGSIAVALQYKYKECI
jgi:hypothetical protein